LLERRPPELSGGQRQRVAKGRAILRNPQVFLFDEPLSNLDAKLRAQTRLEIQKLHRELGVTSQFVTHDQVETMTLAQRIVGREVLRLWAGASTPPLLSSFKPEALTGAAETAPAIPRALLLDALNPGWLEQVAALGCRAVATNYNLMDKPVIAAIHAAGIKALLPRVRKHSVIPSL